MSPYLVGNVAGVVDLEARLTAQRTDTSGSQQGDTASRTSSVRATGGRASLRWSLAWVEENMRYDGSRSNAVQRLDGSVAYTPHYDWRLSARAGRERADVLALQAETRNSWGLGVNWKPSPRTELDANLDERYFGQGYRMLFGYRTPRTTWRITASRDVSSNSAFGVDASTVREYERLYELLASQIEDPVRRDLAVRELLGARTNVLTSSASVQRRIDVSGLWSGVRTSLAVSAYRSSTGRLDRASSAQDDLSRVTRLNQSGFDVSLGYRASPTGRVEMSWARRITGGGGSQPGNTLETTQLSWSEQLWRRASLVTSLRHTQFQADANPYTENGASLTFNLRF
jgi:uncharacterized protein (PEP-CTERM system associated)